MSTGLIEIMKQAALDVVENSNPCDLRYGEVVSTTPLKVKITQYLTLPESVLVVPEHLKDHTVQVTINWETESGKKTMLVHRALKVGDKVALLRQAGGQSYFILDRI